MQVVFAGLADAGLIAIALLSGGSAYYALVVASGADAVGFALFATGFGYLSVARHYNIPTKTEFGNAINPVLQFQQAATISKKSS
ncbi:MAG: hypothetical protein KA715_06650 [Xanthomonadaceae bacterium]|nr:hypothetical protein [Xanthomonadaceae bacterium]